MNQQMNLLEARAVARDRERQLRPHPRAPRQRLSARRLVLPLLGRRAAGSEGYRPRHALAAR
ncbi:hypothetical protein [Ornithinimicrobium pekingense]|uniref:Uncharacterized protein n=1 Tax=Ornithinimicrobium pekingense TaxID=384677 RepID=A0ABQ2F730_9MICO|nr:hypothetical protein [Ornithinimicrobium pekingense]GGK65483.1 hypothetical protein GCM10011509_12160 [Ornithinimicrobium pekingense]